MEAAPASAAAVAAAAAAPAAEAMGGGGSGTVRRRQRTRVLDGLTRNGKRPSSSSSERSASAAAAAIDLVAGPAVAWRAAKSSRSDSSTSRAAADTRPLLRLGPLRSAQLLVQASGGGLGSLVGRSNAGSPPIANRVGSGSRCRLERRAAAAAALFVVGNLAAPRGYSISAELAGKLKAAATPPGLGVGWCWSRGSITPSRGRPPAPRVRASSHR